VVQRDELVKYCSDFFSQPHVKDYAPNGLQVSGSTEINKIVSGVTACQELLDRAVAENADLVVVHHGFFWKGEDPCIVGMQYKRIKTLLANEINLLAYHLPLDCNKDLGNNVMLAKELDFTVDGVHSVDGMPLLFSGHLKEPMFCADFSELLNNKLQRAPTVVGDTDKKIQTIAWCTGAAQDYIFDAVQLGVDAYLSGEISERTTHFARENAITYFGCGHHATERYGVRAFGEHLAKQFAIEHLFIDIDNPV